MRKSQIIVGRVLNPKKRRYRWPLKGLIFLIGTFLVLFPRVDRFFSQLRLPLNRNALVDPQSAALVPLVEEFERTRQADWDGKTLLGELERFVRAKIIYAFDWDLWGNVDYFPTVEEAVALGHEDCDGQAVVFASLARRYGFDAHLVGNLSHVWVTTNLGDTMSPGKSRAFTMADDALRINWSALADIPREFSIGVALFPLRRELILVSLVWLLMAGRNVSLGRAATWLLLLMLGLMLVREGGQGRSREFSTALIGFGAWIAGFVALWMQARRTHPAIEP